MLMVSTRKFLNTKQIALLATVFAIMIAFLIFLPMNAIIPLIALVVIAETGDVKMAGLGGLMFGLASFLSALFFPSTPLYPIFLNPLVSIIPRVIVGLMIYIIYKQLYKYLFRRKEKKFLELKDDIRDSNKLKSADYLSMTVAAISGAIINTVLVLGMMFILYYGREYELNQFSILVKPAVVLPLVAISVITEPIACAIVAPPIVSALKRVR